MPSRTDFEECFFSQARAVATRLSGMRGISHAFSPLSSPGTSSGTSSGTNGGTGGRELEQPATGTIALILEHPDGAVGTLFDLADALAHVETLRLACAIAAELHAHQRFRGQPADEAIAIPVRKQLARIDDEPGRRDHRRPADQGWLEFGTG